jgi:Ca2+-binding EF-hand superfamily protein
MQKSIDEDTLADWKEAFDSFDEKKQGTITVDTLRLVMLNLGRDLSSRKQRNHNSVVVALP